MFQVKELSEHLNIYVFSIERPVAEASSVQWTVLSLCLFLTFERREVIVDAKCCTDLIFGQPNSGGRWHLCNGRNQLGIVLSVVEPVFSSDEDFEADRFRDIIFLTNEFSSIAL